MVHTLTFIPHFIFAIILTLIQWSNVSSPGECIMTNLLCFSYTFLLSDGHRQHNASNDTLVEWVRITLFLGKAIAFKREISSRVNLFWLPWLLLKHECRSRNCSDHPLTWGNGKEEQSHSLWRHRTHWQMLTPTLLGVGATWMFAYLNNISWIIYYSQAYIILMNTDGFIWAYWGQNSIYHRTSLSLNPFLWLISIIIPLKPDQCLFRLLSNHSWFMRAFSFHSAQLFWLNVSCALVPLLRGPPPGGLISLNPGTKNLERDSGPKSSSWVSVLQIPRVWAIYK